MKTFSEYILLEAAMTDMDIAVYPVKVKMNKDGEVSSYSLEIKLEDDTSKIIKDASLAKEIIKYLGDAEVKSSIAISPKAMLFNTEVYQDTKGTFVELGAKKVYFKG